MATITKEDVIPSLIPNTTMQKSLHDGVHKTYVIASTDGYVLHDNRSDWTEPDLTTGEEITKEGFLSGSVSVRYDYDFNNVTQGTFNGVSVTKYGAYELYAIAESEVPADQIFGGGDNDHEVM